MKKMIIREITDTKEKQDIARFILESLTDWFGVSESRESYIRESADRFFAAVFDKDQPIGFICLKETGKDTAEISVMGVLKEYHRKGAGTALFKKAKVEELIAPIPEPKANDPAAPSKSRTISSYNSTVGLPNLE